MAVLALSEDLSDMRERLGRMVIGSSKAGGYARDSMGRHGTAWGRMGLHRAAWDCMGPHGAPPWVHIGLHSRWRLPCTRSQHAPVSCMPLFPPCGAGDVVTADDLGVGGALTVLMKDTIEPTLMQVGVFYKLWVRRMAGP